MPTRTNTEVVNNLPVFVAKRSQDFKAWAIVTCPRSDCGEMFLVKMSTWFKPHHYGKNRVLITGRACPYCFKAGRLPPRPR